MLFGELVATKNDHQTDETHHEKADDEKSSRHERAVHVGSLIGDTIGEDWTPNEFHHAHAHREHIGEQIGELKRTKNVTVSSLPKTFSVDLR